MSSSQPGEDGVERLEDRHLGAEVRQQRGELAPDDAAADDGHRGRQLLEVEELVRRHDPAPVDLEAGQQVRGTDPAARTTLRPTTTAAGVLPVDHLDAAVGLERARPDQRRDLAPLEQSGQALEQLVDHRVLAVLAHSRSRPTRPATSMPNSLEPAIVRRTDGRLEEFLGGDAATVQAGPADLVPLDDGDREAGRGGVERSGVAARPTADHDDVELVLACSSPVLFLSCSRGSSGALGLPGTSRSHWPESSPRPPARARRSLRPLPFAPRHQGRRRRRPLSRSSRRPNRPPGWPARPPGRSSGHPSVP